MNRTILTVAVTCLAFAGFRNVAWAHEDDEQDVQPVYQEYGQRSGHREFGRQPRGSRLDSEVHHLNRMLQHVEREMRRYRPDRHIRRQYQHIRAEAYELNHQFRRGAQYYDRRRLRAQIAHMHSELHHIEEDLHVPANEYYQWR